ncbi:MAG: carbohydrate porin [Variovorax sp.]|nr:carbohydrate porin [Variovorax sp.]
MTFPWARVTAHLFFLGMTLACTPGQAAEMASSQDGPAESIAPASDFEVHGQATYIFQRKPGFRAAYSGPNSLSPQPEHSYSFTSTVFVGWRPVRDLEFYFNPEVVQGLPMSRLVGLGGLTNSELQKTAGTNPVIYRARAFVRKTWGLGGGTEEVESDANQLPGSRDQRRLVLTAGNFAGSDIFDQNTYAHDGRTRFLNWALLMHGAYDYASDARGYSWGAALEYFDGDWAVRAGRLMEPKESNGLKLDWALKRHHGDQVEVERGWKAGDQPGRARFLLYRNTAVMGAFQDANLLAAATGTTPDVALVRRQQSKTGWGINLEQAIDDTSGVFARWGRHDGRTETFSFAEIDRSFSTGAVIGGARWGRPKDTLGIAWARNGLSGPHREYLAAGGLGFFIGDGALLRYRPESIVETYYEFGFGKGPRSGYTVMVGFQRIRNPAYNADRGPVNTASVRLHAEF